MMQVFNPLVGFFVENLCGWITQGITASSIGIGASITQLFSHRYFTATP